MNSELRGHIIETLNKGIRLDGRKATEYREVKLERSPFKNAEGSAKVTIGDTELIAGVKLALETPYPDLPDEGTMAVGAELLPLSNPDFESGPPGIEAIELARVVDRGIRESGTIDTKKLCIKAGEKVWMIYIDIVTVNVDGNLFDASALAAMAALQETVFPKLVDEKVDYGEKTKEKLPLSKAPVSITVCKIGDHLIIDPTNEEEQVIDARLTVASLKDGTICAMQKGGNYPLTVEDINKMVDLALDKAKELRKHLEK